ncbi:unnamed protein product [Caenorhabditis bovis]|uniref:Secreted protein n=1 Tax=Caenorhabditis bovis TaxID=2654633 RepID=A0A8S1ER02_9PELO|nr:unnamed protein product [Caenorhabditis bovis]
MPLFVAFCNCQYLILLAFLRHASPMERLRAFIIYMQMNYAKRRESPSKSAWREAISSERIASITTATIGSSSTSSSIWRAR